MTKPPTTTQLTAAALGALDDAFFAPMTLWSPLAQPIVDLMYAGANDVSVPAPDAVPTGHLLEAIELLLAPRFGCSVVFTRGTQGAWLTLFHDEERVVRFDRHADYLYNIWGPVTVGEAANLLAEAIPAGRPSTSNGQHSAAVSTAGYFALTAWIGLYREAALPLGLDPADGVVDPEQLTRYMASPDMLGTLTEMSMLGAPVNFATAFAQAPTDGVEELQRAGILMHTGDGLVLTDPGRSIAGPIAFPAMSMSVSTVELETNRAATTTITAAPGSGIVSLDVQPREDRWTFTLRALGDDQVLDTIAAALQPSVMFTGPPGEDEASWQTPLLDGLRETFSEPGMD